MAYFSRCQGRDYTVLTRYGFAGLDTLRASCLISTPMITGYNTDVPHEGRVYHVQTEDKGRDNPVVESLVYAAGEIVTSRRSSYAELLEAPGYSESEVQRRMESQHQAIIREILSGRYDPDGPKPFGYNIVTNRSLDEVVHEFLTQKIGLEQIRLEMENQVAIFENTEPTVRLRVVAEASDRPVGGAKVFAKWISNREKPREIFRGETGADGRVQASIRIPALDGANAAVLFQAEAAGNNAELKKLVLPEES